jgi:ABC-2 type transport system permease protein
MSALMHSMADMTDELMDMMQSEGVEMLPGMDAMMGGISDIYTLEMTYMGSLATIGQIAVIVIMVLLIGTAGSEQKKRSIILPQVAGLTPSGYVVPKFILFPPLTFVMTLLSAMLANVASLPVFGEAMPFETVMLTGTLYGLFMMFMVCLYLFLGISLVQPGLSIVYVLGGSMVVSLMLTVVFEIDRFTPWNLTVMSDSMVMFGSHTVDNGTMIVTAVITFMLCLVLFAATWFAMVAKRMDNTADEVY